MFRTITVIDKSGFTQPQVEVELENEEDKITVDVPLLIRLLEYAKEDAKDDVELHNIATKLIELSEEGDCLNMSNYAEIVGKPTIMTEKTMEFRPSYGTVEPMNWLFVNPRLGLKYLLNNNSCQILYFFLFITYAQRK